MGFIDYKSDKFSRRDFLKNSGKAILALSGFITFHGVLSSCATFNYNEEAPIIYPPLNGHKVHPPNEGCFIGFMGSGERRAGDWSPRKDENPEIRLSIYKDQISHSPAILTKDPIYSDMTLSFPGIFISKTHEAGTIPFVYYSIKSAINQHGSLKNLINNKEFLEDTRKFAVGVANLQTPLFLCTMREVNGYWYKWGAQPKTAKALWKQIWQIFEDTGANEYATWVLEIFCPIRSVRNIGYPGHYYPGDKYVDWIGFSAFARSNAPATDISFSSLVGPTYKSMRTDHPDKPIIISELGISRSSRQSRSGKISGKDTDYQAKWLQKAFTDIKSWPGMKAVIISNQLTWAPGLPATGDDHTLDKSSKALLQQVMNGGYFLGS